MTEFIQYVKDNSFLDLYNKEELLNDNNNLQALSLFIKSNPNIVKLNLARCNIDKDKIKLLIDPINDSNITDLDIATNKLGDEGAAEIAKLTKLINLDIACNSIGNDGTAEVAKLSNLTSLDIGSNYIGDVATDELANKLLNLTYLSIYQSDLTSAGAAKIAKKLLKLTNLDISWNNIGDDGAAEIAKLPCLTKLGIARNSLSCTGIEELANLINYVIDMGDKKEQLFLSLLQKAKQKNPNGNLAPEDVKNIVFAVTPHDREGEFIKHIINSPKKYPFAINSRDAEGHSLLHFYNHLDEMQEFLFKNGIIPEQKQQDRILERLARDNQGVHTKEAVDLTNFVTRELIEAYHNAPTIKSLEELSKEYHKLALAYKDPISSVKLALLSLTDGSKRDTMGEALKKSDQTVPDDRKFVNTIIDIASKALTEQYLVGGYSTNELRYDDNTDHIITIPESLGLVKSLIDTMEISVADKRELLVTLMVKFPKLVANKLKIIQEKLGVEATLEELANSQESHQLLKNTDPKIVADIFEIISSFGIEDTWREQKYCTLAERIYMAATNYDGKKTACIHGAWDHIINSATEINPIFLDKFNKFKEEQDKKEKERTSITESNIQEFVAVLTEKLIKFVKDKPELKESLEDLASAMIDVKKPQEITIEQQNILAQIHEAFINTIKTYLHNYNRAIPEFEEYKTIIDMFSENNTMRQFYLSGNQQTESDVGIMGDTESPE